MTERALQPAALVENLSYQFAGRKVPSLYDISFAIPRGTITVIAGRTGSGKSTLLRALAGLIPHHAAGQMGGSVELFGRDTRAAAANELAATAGLVLQNPDEQICTTTVASEVAFGLANLGLPAAEIECRVGQWLERFGLSEIQNQSTATLSGGQKQRLLLASILAMGPRLLLCDEPLAQLDAPAATELREQLAILRREGMTIVVAEHRLDELLALADRVLVVDGGRLCADHAADDPRLTAELKRYGLAIDRDAKARRLTVERISLPAPDPSSAPILQAAAIAWQFRRRPPVWENLSFEIRPAERVVVLGPNGSGKSTLLHTLAGFWRPTAGHLSFNSADPGHTAFALVPQNPDLTLISRTVAEELCFGPNHSGLSREEATGRAGVVAAGLGLTELLDESPLALSQGQRLRVALGAVLALRPRLLLLDEPTTGQDPQEVARLMSVLQDFIQHGHIGAVLYSTHDLSLAAQFATRALLLAGGQLLANGPVAELLADKELLHRAGLMREESGARAAPESPSLPSGAAAKGAR